MKTPFLIGIVGGSGSGKTRFLNKLLQHFSEKEVCLISQDNYYRPREEQPEDERGVRNFDLPESLDLEAYKQDIMALRGGHTVKRTEYTFNNPAVTPAEIVLRPAPVIVVEGLFVLHYREIADLLDLKIFIEARDYIKLKRRIIRDDRERGYDLEDVLYRYEHHVMPTYHKYIEPYKYNTDLIIPNHDGFDRALEVVAAFIRERVR